MPDEPIDLPDSCVITAAPGECLLAVDWCCEEGLELSAAALDASAELSYVQAVRMVHALRAKLCEIRAVCRESGCVRD